MTQLKSDQAQMAKDLEELRQEVDKFILLGDLKQARALHGGLRALGEGTAVLLVHRFGGRRSIGVRQAGGCGELNLSAEPWCCALTGMHRWTTG